MSMKQATSIIIFLSIISFCCNSSESTIQNYLAASSRDTLIQEIPKYSNVDESNIYKYIKQMAGKLNIGRIDSGYSPLQIRIWYYYGLIDTNQLFLLKLNDQKWEASWYTIAFNLGSLRTDTSISIVSNKAPISGWNSFLNRLFKLKIGELPDMNILPGRNTFLMAEPKGVLVEFAAINNYRLFSYDEPSAFIDRWWQARNMKEILSLIENEFHFKQIKEL